jgi:hypothetical protein
MATLVKPAVRFGSYFLTLVSALYLVSLLCDRAYVLHLTYAEESARLRKDRWIVEQCRRPEFFEALAASCGEAERGVMRNLALYSLKRVLETTFLCGTQSCAAQAATAAAWFIGLSAPAMCLLGAMAVLCPVVLVQALRAVGEAFRPPRPALGAYYALPEQPPSLARYPVYQISYPDAGGA